MATSLERGKKYRQSHDYTRADLEFKNAIQAMPRNEEPYYQIGLLYLEQGELSLAVKAFRKTLEINPKHTAAQIKLAELMAATGDKDLLARANLEAQQLAAAAPNNTEVLNVLAMTDLKLHKPEEAVRLLEQAVKDLPGDLKAASNLATVKLAQKDFAGAEKALKDAQAAQPKSPKPLIALGRLYWMMGKPDQASQQFHLALQMDPNNGTILRDVAELARARGQQQEAAQAFRRLSQLPPAENRTLYGLYLTETGKSQEAISEFERLVKTDPADRRSRTLLVTLYARAGRINDGGRVLAEALKRNSKDTEALIQQAQILLSERKLDAAEQDLQQALRMEANSATAHYAMGLLLRTRGRLSYARQELTKAVELNPNLLSARLALIQVLFSLNAANDALEVANRTPPAQSGTPEIVVQRNWALMATGKWTELRQSIDQALAAIPHNSELLLQDGIWKVQHKDYVQGEKSLAAALEGTPDDLRPLRVIAGIQIAQKQPALALAKVTEYASRYPKNASMQQFLGESLLANQNPAQARSVFLAIKASNPNFVAADLSLAQCDLAEGHTEEARKRLLSLTNSQQVGAEANLLLGSLEDNSGKPADAADYYRAALKLEPDNVMALNNLAYVLGSNGADLDGALEYAKRAKDLAPDSGVVEDTLGWLLFKKGLYEQSVQELEGAVSHLPSAVPKYHLSMAYSMARQPDQASRILRDALKQDPKLPEANQALKLVSVSRR